MNATLQPSRSRQRLKKAHLGLRFAITAFVFVAIIAVVSLAAFAVRGALVRRGLDFRSVAQGIVRYLERARLAVAREARESGASGRQNSTGDVAATAALRPSSEGLAPLGVNLRASSPAIRASRASAVRDAVAFEEFCSLPPGVAGVNDAGRAQSAFELVNAWTAEQRAKLVAAAPCSWAMHQQSEIRLPPVPLCGKCSRCDAVPRSCATTPRRHSLVLIQCMALQRMPSYQLLSSSGAGGAATLSTFSCCRGAISREPRLLPHTPGSCGKQHETRRRLVEMLGLSRHSLLLQAFLLWSRRTGLSRGALGRGLLSSTLGLILVGGVRWLMMYISERLSCSWRNARPTERSLPMCRTIF